MWLMLLGIGILTLIVEILTTKPMRYEKKRKPQLQECTI